jgi:hypothetical protein
MRKISLSTKAFHDGKRAEDSTGSKITHCTLEGMGRSHHPLAILGQDGVL